MLSSKEHSTLWSPWGLAAAFIFWMFFAIGLTYLEYPTDPFWVNYTFAAVLTIPMGILGFRFLRARTVILTDKIIDYGIYRRTEVSIDEVRTVTLSLAGKGDALAPSLEMVDGRTVVLTHLAAYSTKKGGRLYRQWSALALACGTPVDDNWFSGTHNVVDRDL